MANKFILGRLGENQPYKVQSTYVNTIIGDYWWIPNVQHLQTSFHKKIKLVRQMVALDLNLPFKQAGLVPVRLLVILGKLINKTATTGRSRPESPK